jgi:hypothetical protein
MKYKIDTVLKLTDKGIRLPDDLQPAKQRLFDFCNKSRGGYLRVTLAPPYKKRSTGDKSQNHHLNGHCQQIANETGEDFDIIKMHVKRTAIKYGYPTYEDVFGELQPKSEADTDTIECGYAIEACHEIAAFLGVVLDEK